MEPRLFPSCYMNWVNAAIAFFTKDWNMQQIQMLEKPSKGGNIIVITNSLG